MSLPYIQISSEETMDGKRNVLFSEMGLLNLAKKAYSYKKLRKQELAKKSILKKEVRKCLKGINSLMREIPEIDAAELKIEKEIPMVKETPGEIGKKRSIEQELIDIQGKLARLNR